MNRIKLFSLLVASSIVLLSCGGGETSSDGTQTTETNTTTPGQTDTSTAAPATNEVAELSLQGNDQMQFDKKEFRVKAGQTVRLTLTHAGTMAKNAMGHNFVLLKEGVDVATFGQQSATAMDTDYIPASQEGNIIAHTKMLGGGESDTIEFTAPAAGSYEFLCSFPGHYALMRGVFIVE
jgi:azurin